MTLGHMSWPPRQEISPGSRRLRQSPHSFRKKETPEEELFPLPYSPQSASSAPAGAAEPDSPLKIQELEPRDPGPSDSGRRGPACSTRSRRGETPLSDTTVALTLQPTGPPDAKGINPFTTDPLAPVSFTNGRPRTSHFLRILKSSSTC